MRPVVSLRESAPHQDKSRLAFSRNLLTSLRREIEARIRRYEVALERVSEPQEQAQILQRNELSAASIQRDRKQLAAVDEALYRLDRGLYGICERCSGEIPARRLELVPTAIYCAPCQSRMEAREKAEARFR